MEQFEIDIKKAHTDRINAIVSNFKESDNIQKSHTANIGEIRDWGGKKYKKQANGKWLEVSEHGKTKEEHLYHKKEWGRAAERNEGKSDKKQSEIKEMFDLHSQSASKLSDKEHDESELSGGEGDEKSLIKKYKDGTITPQEKETLLKIQKDKNKKDTIDSKLNRAKNNWAPNFKP